jgi:hypothetical protein
MKTLDLHGLYHSAVQQKVENFVLLNETPIRIITGNSLRMKEIVKQIVEKYDFKCHYETDYNLGSLIILNNR